MHSKCRFYFYMLAYNIAQHLAIVILLTILFVPGMKKLPSLPWTSVDPYATMYLAMLRRRRDDIYHCIIPFRVVSCRHGGVQVHLGVVPQEAERCHALSAPHQVLAVSPAHQGRTILSFLNYRVKVSQ